MSAARRAYSVSPRTLRRRPRLSAIRTGILESFLFAAIRPFRHYLNTSQAAAMQRLLDMIRGDD